MSSIPQIEAVAVSAASLATSRVARLAAETLDVARLATP